MSTTFFNSTSGVTAVGNTFVGLVDTTNVQINPAKEDGNLATISAALNVALSTRASEVTLAALNTKVTTTANGIKVDASATTQPVSGTISANVKDGSGNAISSTIGALDVFVTGGGTFPEQHAVDSSGDTYTAGTTQGVVADARVVAASPSLTAGQFSALNVSLAGRLIIDGSGVTQPVSTTSLPLPTGAATEITLALVNTNLDQLTYASTRLLVDGSGVTQPVSGTVTANIGATNGLALDATLSAASAKLPATLGQKTMANSLAIVVASDQSNLPSNTTQWGGSATTLGQKLMASSVPVTLSSDQSALAVSQSGTWNITDVSGTISLPTGAATEATLLAAKVDLDKFTFASTRLLTDGSGVTQPVSGTVTANIGTSGSLALDTSVGKLNVSQGAALGSNTGPMIQGSVTTASPAYSTGNIDPLSLTTAGALRVDATSTVQPVYIQNGNRSTYSATAVALAPGAAATDVFTLTGSATTTVNIKRIKLDYEATVSDVATVNLIKRSTANTGGTSTALTIIPYDSNNATATAVARSYTANPTLGTAVGTMRTTRVVSIDATPAAASNGYVYDLFNSKETSQAITLRGTSQVLAINLNGVTLSGASLYVTIEWSEE